MATILPASLDAYERAAHCLRGGGLVILPTETVYGLAASSGSDGAADKIYAAKSRPANKALPRAITHRRQMVPYQPLPAMAGQLMDTFWPGPLTLVVPTNAGGSAALRMPDSDWARSAAFRKLNAPLFLTSANRSGEPAAMNAQDARSSLGSVVDIIIDGGPIRGRRVSTIVKIDQSGGAKLIRAGALCGSALAAYKITL